jgi:hypothetical protein
MARPWHRRRLLPASVPFKPAVPVVSVLYDAEGVRLLDDAGPRGVQLAAEDDTLVAGQGVITTPTAGDSIPAEFVLSRSKAGSARR